MPAIVAIIAQAFAKFLANDLLKWVAIKIVLTTLAVVILPIILNNVMYDFLDTVLQFANSKVGSTSGYNQILSITGVAAYLADKFQLVSSFTVLLSAISVRVVLNHIPWVRI